MAQQQPAQRDSVQRHPAQRGRGGALVALAVVALSADPAAALPLVADLSAWVAVQRHLLAAALTLGAGLFALAVVALLLHAHRRAARDRAAARQQIAALRAEGDRYRTLLHLDRQIIVVWGGPGEEPEISGDLEIAGVSTPLRVLAYGTWLDPLGARDLEAAVDRLRARGEAFALALGTRAGRHVEADGRAIGGHAVLRLREITGAREEARNLAERLRCTERDSAVLHTLVENLPVPVWGRDGSGRLIWANAAYAQAVEAKTPEDALTRGIELLERDDRREAQDARSRGGRFAKRVAAIVAGERRQLDIVELATPDGASAGIALDATEAEQVRAGLQQTIAAHRRILDSLATGVAIFDARKQLAFYNPAYQRLFGLDASFLDEHPSDPDVLDRLRAMRKLPEQADFRTWRDSFLSAYRALEPQERSWHLPGGQTLRVVTNPNPDGGLTYLFDDISEHLDLVSRINQLSGLHRETLDSLAEAVAVFGSDGRLKLNNPAFARLWRLSPNELAKRPHVEEVAAWCAATGPGDAWRALRATVTAIGIRHEPVARRIERADSSVLDATAAKLPDGSTLLTFRDVTDSVSVERALSEKNAALEQADQLKTRFVHHVSYELRSPLTNIIGFAQLLDDPKIGPLNDKQHAYVGHITSSSTALLAIIDDILDLATIDSGAMSIETSDVDVQETMKAAAEGVQDRVTENDIKLVLDAAPGCGTFTADARRVRQVLFNLLSNAIRFSPTGGTVTLAARIEPDAVAFRVADQGPGIPDELKDKVFEPFESFAADARSKRGVGLGLPIARSLVALHGGSMQIESGTGAGTIVTVRFPIKHAAAAE